MGGGAYYRNFTVFADSFFVSLIENLSRKMGDVCLFIRTFWHHSLCIHE